MAKDFDTRCKKLKGVTIRRPVHWAKWCIR
jgi:hypothetical protein